jgi:uncharacterized membrane protein
MLASFGTFWSAQGVGVSWPGSDAAILGLLALYVATAAGYVYALRRGMLGAGAGQQDRADRREPVVAGAEG